MTTTAMRLESAADERRAHLVRCVAMYEARGWTDLVAEYRVRLDELDRLLLFVNVAEMTEREARAMAGDR